MPDIHHDNQTQQYLDLLYELDGRSNPAHPMHSLYTGLYQSRIRSLLRSDRELLLSGVSDE